MRNMKAVLVLLFFSCSVISASAQSSGSNTQKPPASRAKPSPTPKDPAAGGGTKAKKLVAIEPLPVFCV